eukprot:scaffold68193_cov33-Tisochrysis_lutea.AAC.4
MVRAKPRIHRSPSRGSARAPAQRSASCSASTKAKSALKYATDHPSTEHRLFPCMPPICRWSLRRRIMRAVRPIRPLVRGSRASLALCIGGPH